MKFFLDTANVEGIKRVVKLGLLDGVTTNPTLIAKEGRDFEVVIKEICQLVDGPVSAEVIGLTVDEMLDEAHQLAQWASNVVVKLPMTEAGIEATHHLAKEGIKTNVTLIFTESQGLMAMKAGATYISPFVGRLDDAGVDGMQLVRNLKTIVMQYQFQSEIIVASVRNTTHVAQAALAGAHIATIPGSALSKMWQHPLTDVGIESFLADWEAFKKNQ